MKLEVFEDRMYFDQWCVRPEGSSDFNDTIHFIRKIDALLAQRVIEGWIAQSCAAECEAFIALIENYAQQYHEPVWAFDLIKKIRARGER